jgi:hypothetical protein
MKIFTVTTLYLKDDAIAEQRMWGWYPTFVEAEEAVLLNLGDIYEAGTFNKALIEAVNPGIMPIDSEETWYDVAYTRVTVDFTAVENYTVKVGAKPKFLGNVICFSMG